MLPLNETFETVQGEAFFTGTPATFLRLQGCDVGCPWCDTKYTWDMDDTRVRPFSEIAFKSKEDDSYAWASVAQLVHLCGKSPLVVITGGEPCDHNLEDLTNELMIAGVKQVQIETSGTAEVRACPETWVTVSPKIGMPGGKPIWPSAVERANEIKMPIGKPADVDKLKAFLSTYMPPTKLIWLQPLSCSPKATDLCIAAARENGWRLSAQLHKYIHVR